MMFDCSVVVSGEQEVDDRLVPSHKGAAMADPMAKLVDGSDLGHR
jgi:hypothetical protein